MKLGTVKLTGQDGNVFNVIGLARKALVKEGKRKEAEEMVDLCLKSGTYHEVFGIISKYLNIK